MITDALRTAYKLNADWIKANEFVFQAAKDCGLAVAGSIARALGRKRADSPPNDIDFVAVSEHDAMAFISALQVKLLTYPTHFRIYVNSRNEYVPPGSLIHFRIQTAFWLPICVMVIAPEAFKFWFAQGGMRVQLFKLAAEAGRRLDERDNKGRCEGEEELAADEEANTPALMLQFTMGEAKAERFYGTPV